MLARMLARETLASSAVTDGANLGVYMPDYYGNYRTVAGVRPDTMGLTGKFYDEDLGLYYFYARWSDPERGRWMSEEPYGIDGMNHYWFSRNKPNIYVDVNGFSSSGTVMSPTPMPKSKPSKVSRVDLMFGGSPDDCLNKRMSDHGLTTPLVGGIVGLSAASVSLLSSSASNPISASTVLFIGGSLAESLHWCFHEIDPCPTDPVEEAYSKRHEYCKKIAQTGFDYEMCMDGLYAVACRQGNVWMSASEIEDRGEPF